MAFIIAITLSAWLLTAAIKIADKRNKRRQIEQIAAESRAKQDERIQMYREWKVAQAKATEEWKEAQARAMEEHKRMIEIAKEQERQAREQARQAEQLARHEERIARLEFDMMQAKADIETERERINGLYALLDIAEANQAAAAPGSKADEAAQRKIISLTGQIAAAEKRMRKAQHTRSEAEKKLSA